MSRTLPRAEGARPGKFVSRSTLIAGADDTGVFPLTERRDCSAARREVKENRGGFCWKGWKPSARASRASRHKKGTRWCAPFLCENQKSGGGCSCGGFAMAWRGRFFAFPAHADDFGD